MDGSKAKPKRKAQSSTSSQFKCGNDGVWFRADEDSPPVWVCARLDVLEGMEGVVASQGPRSGMALESLAWALTLHCRPTPSADCAPLRRRAQALLQEQAALPPLERRMLSAALADD